MKYITPIFFLIFLSVNIKSQSNLKTGLIIGYNSSTFTGNDKPGKDLQSIPGFYLGGIIDFPVNHKFTLTGNAALSTKGTMINTIDDLKETVLFVYLDLPIMLKYKPLPEKKLQPYFITGGAFDYSVLATSANGGALFDIKNVDLGLVAGTGLETGKISLELRYCPGLRKFDNSDLKLGLRNSTLSVLLGIKFN